MHRHSECHGSTPCPGYKLFLFFFLVPSNGKWANLRLGPNSLSHFLRSILNSVSVMFDPENRFWLSLINQTISELSEQIIWRVCKPSLQVAGKTPKTLKEIQSFHFYACLVTCYHFSVCLMEWIAPSLQVAGGNS